MVVKKAHFAQTLMKKYGWSEGAGLGKREQGRQAPVKVLMKMDKTGLGSKPGEEMANPWWAKAFNKHCKKIRRRNADSEDSDVSSDSDESDSEDENEGAQEFDNVGRKINSKRAVSMRIKNARKQFYNNFISSGNLKGDHRDKFYPYEGDPSIMRNADGKKRRIALRLKQLKQYKKDKIEKAERQKNPSTEKNSSTFAGMTNEQMFKACNGRTAHRAAKFGLGLGGKLARLEAQEKLAKEKRAAENLKKKEEDSIKKAQAVIKMESK